MNKNSKSLAKIAKLMEERNITTLATHSRHIKETGEVAFAIFDSNQPVKTKSGHNTT